MLWDDGEDEWVDVTREPLTWHADRLKTTGFSAGLSSGQIQAEVVSRCTGGINVLGRPHQQDETAAAKETRLVVESHMFLGELRCLRSKAGSSRWGDHRTGRAERALFSRPASAEG